jgi:hypothetical protein
MNISEQEKQKKRVEIHENMILIYNLFCEIHDLEVISADEQNLDSMTNHQCDFLTAFIKLDKLVFDVAYCRFNEQTLLEIKASEDERAITISE